MEVVQTLWFANGMDAALTFYTSLIPGSGIDTQWTMAAAGPAGSVRVATFHLGDQRYQAMEAG
ncbi:VOC family protein, partial [Haematobacter missouriensis]